MAEFETYPFSAPTPPYTAGAVHFDGSTDISTSGALGTDSPFGIMSFWIANWVAASFRDMFRSPDGTQSLTSVGGIHEASLNLQTSSSNNFTCHTPPFGTTPTWMNVLASWDMNHAAGSRILNVYYTDVVQTNSIVSDQGIAFSVPYSGVTNWVLCSTSNGRAPVWDMADFQLWAGTFLDLSVTANRRLFIDVNKKPVDPIFAATTLGVKQTLLLQGNSTSFATNRGNGPSVSVTNGALTDAGSHP